MRISIEKDDPGYTKFACHALVTLNDKPLKDVIMADEKLAEATIYVREVGSVLGKPKSVYGRIKISFPTAPNVEEQLRKP